MVKLKKTTAFVCQECGYDSPAYLGKCPECGNWNSFKEIHIQPAVSESAARGIVSDNALVQPLQDISISKTTRVSSGFKELDTVLGGGIVPGSAILLAGDPGIGKSTLLLQLCLTIAQRGEKVLYITGEESAEQIKLRANRVNKNKAANENLLILSTTDIDAAMRQVQEIRPTLVVLDSVQTMQSINVAGFSGAVGQVRYTAMQCIRAAKQLSIPTILVGHVTKEGMVAGPMVLSHMVDTVLFLEGEKFTPTKLLRSLKNRFGPIDEVGVFQMDEKGMSDVKNPEQIFITDKQKNVPGSVRVITLEGSRAFLVELQALVVYSKLAMPRRVVSGLDQRRIELLLAVLQKHARLPVETMDVFVNVAGGLKIADPAVDLGICLAIYSSLKNISFADTVGIAEVGLLGELRAVSNVEKRIKEAKNLGFSSIITNKSHRYLVDVLGSKKHE